MRLIRDALAWAICACAWHIGMALYGADHSTRRGRFFLNCLGLGGIWAFSPNWEEFRHGVQWNVDGRPQKHAYIEYLRAQ